MMRFIITFLILLPILVFSEERVWIYFKDKGPYLQKRGIEHARSHLTQRALERRYQRTDFPHFDFTDIPVYQEYINVLENLNITIHMRSKWFNAVSVYLNGNDPQVIQDLPFVRNISTVKVHRFNQQPPETAAPLLKPSVTDYGPSDNQNRMIGIPAAHILGYTGQGVRIALFDTGFILEHESLQHIKRIDSWDFIQGDAVVSNQEGDSPSQHNHGTLVLSAIGGYFPGQLIGPAYAAEYVLAKTEDISSERKVEEDNWVAAAEWADSLGVDIISTSLGYSIFDPAETDYSYADMDGNTAIITRAADLAVRKGILVFASAGNEGDSNWYYITAPADGDSVITMGAVHPNGTRASFSSHGPTADNRIKPDLMAQGTAVYCAAPNTEDLYTAVSGTSLSCPLGAGAAAVLLSVIPQLHPMQVRDLLISTSTRAQNPDNDYGYGIINLEKALARLLSDPIALIRSFIVVTEDGKNIIQWISDAQIKVEFWIVRRHNDHSGPEEIGRIIGKDFDLTSRIYTLADPNLTGGEEYTYSLYARFKNENEVVLDSEEVISQSATTISLLQNFPNPFNNTTRLIFGLDNPDKVSLSVFDIRGRLVKNLIQNEQKEAQFHQVEWDGKTDRGVSLSSGIYYAVLSTSSKTHTIKLVLIR
jgi:serine protease AprX